MDISNVMVRASQSSYRAGPANASCRWTRFFFRDMMEG
jgi:hypothetical protein